MDDERRPLVPNQLAHAVTIADVESAMAIAPHPRLQGLDDRPRRAARAEEPGPQIVVDAGDLPARGAERADARRADQTAGPGDERAVRQAACAFRNSSW
jgi:hypothetical protein